MPQPARDAYYEDTTKHAPYSGGGVRFHGRGYIQLTHDYNYRRYGYEANPEALLQPGPAADVFARYWADRNIGAMADRGDWAACRRAVQGGAAGLDRLIQIATDLLAVS